MTNLNHSEVELLPAEEAMPRMHADTPSQQATRSLLAHKVKQRLTIDPDQMSYCSRGTVTIVWQLYGEWREQEFPIRSLDDQELVEILGRNRLEEREFPMVWNAETQREERDTTSPQFLNYLSEFTQVQQNIRMEKFLFAFDGGEILEKGTRAVVWDSDDPTVRNRDKALKSLFALQIPPHQMQIINDAIDNLSVKKSLTTTESSTSGQPQS